MAHRRHRVRRGRSNTHHLSARSRGHATGEADADPNIPYAGSAMPPSSAGATAPSESSAEYAGGGGEVPERVTINITVQARPV
jgi:hypothetical protein